jgi:hypothetical protein
MLRGEPFTEKHMRPTSVTVAAVLSLLLAVSNFPGPWMALFPGAEEAPDWVIYSGVVLGIAGLVVTAGLWLVARWSYWPAIIVSVLNIVVGAPGLLEAPGAAIKTAIAVSIVVAVVVIFLLMRTESKQALLNRPSPADS